MEETKIIVTGKPLVDFEYIRNVLGDVVEGAIARNIAPAGRLIDPEKADQAVKDSVDRGTPTREIATASRYLMLAAVSICTDSMNAFEHYLDASEDYQRDNAEYMVLDGRKAAAQIQSILGVMSELEGLEEHE
jgi:hypothetical protein